MALYFPIRGKLPVIAVSPDFKLGLNVDGTVSITGPTDADTNYECGQVAEVSSWSGIQSVLTANVYQPDVAVIGLKDDGTVVGTVYIADPSYYCAEEFTPSDWTDIVQLDIGADHLVGVKKDGTVKADGNDEYGQVSGTREWTNIVAVKASFDATMGLTYEGEIVMCGDLSSYEINDKPTGPFSMISYDSFPMAVRPDGTVESWGTENAEGQHDVSGWTNIIMTANTTQESWGLQSDGTLVMTGRNMDGEYDPVLTWTDLVAIYSSGYADIMGLHSNGTVSFSRGNSQDDYNSGADAEANWNNIRIPGTDYAFPTYPKVEKLYPIEAEVSWMWVHY